MDQFKSIQAWQRAVDRVTLHPLWPIPMRVELVTPGGVPWLRCIVSTFDAYADLSDADLVLQAVDVQFSRRLPEVDDPEYELEAVPDCTRLLAVIGLLREAARHELDEFLLVSGQVAAPPHEEHGPPVPAPVLSDKATWQAACDAVTLHSAWGLNLQLSTLNDAQGGTRLTCKLHRLGLSKETIATWIFQRKANPPNAEHIQQLIALVRTAIWQLLDDCLVIDEAPLDDAFRHAPWSSWTVNTDGYIGGILSKLSGAELDQALVGEISRSGRDDTAFRVLAVQTLTPNKLVETLARNGFHLARVGSSVS